MLRNALVERLGLQWRLIARDRKILTLLRGNGDLRLVPSTEVEPSSGLHQVGVFRNKSASLADFARFLAAVTDTEVLDNTGITGRYKFDVDQSREIGGRWGANPEIAYTVVRNLGLKLEAGKRTEKTLVVDRVNKEPTAN
jgi:uncharacterized protein (TIGR03435 family)